MTYLAPRQGLFAIILTISFILHALILVMSNHEQLAQINQQTGERIVEQLISESTLALSSKDKVSLSVLAKRYTSEFDIASLVIRDGEGYVLVSMGDNPLSEGKKITGMATLDDAVLGEITLGLQPISIGKIFSSLWIFILAILLIHSFIWLLYGYVSRPTKAQLAKLSQEVRDHLLKQQPQLARARRGESEAHDATESLTIKPSISDMLKGNTGIRQAVNDYVHEHNVNEQDTEQDRVLATIGSASNGREKSNTAASVNDVISSTKDNLSANSNPNSVNKRTLTTKVKPLTATRNMDVVMVQIQFVDKDNLLAALAPEKSTPYFALCTQLLEQTITSLQDLPILNSVSFEIVAGFGDTSAKDRGDAPEDKDEATGAMVQIKAQNKPAKIGLAAVMLGKLYTMLNRIVYTKHRELQRFALNVKVGVSDEALVEPMQQLMAYHADADDVLILLPRAGMRQLNKHIQLQNIKRPTTVYERECALVIGTDDVMMQRLVDVRNAVLLSGQERID